MPPLPRRCRARAHTPPATPQLTPPPCLPPPLTLQQLFHDDADADELLADSIYAELLLCGDACCAPPTPGGADACCSRCGTDAPTTMPLLQRVLQKEAGEALLDTLASALRASSTPASPLTPRFS